MKIIIRADEQQKNEWLSKNQSADLQLTWIGSEDEVPNLDTDAYFDLLFDEEYISQNKFVKDTVVFANAVIPTCTDLPANYIRINAWNSFLQKDFMEFVCTDMQKQNIENIMKALGWKYHIVPDVPGMIAPRIISMIINEAYFALGDDISTKAEIDTAMKLGTNYPYGPFEWSEKIGLQKIYLLLKKLSSRDERYKIAPKLEEEIKITVLQQNKL